MGLRNVTYFTIYRSFSYLKWYLLQAYYIHLPRGSILDSISTTTPIMLRSYADIYPFFCGIFLTVGLIYLISSMHGKLNRAYFLFGWISIFAGLYFGFVREGDGDQTYSQYTKFYTLFYSLFTLLLPWFIGYFGPLWKPKWLWILTVLMIAAAIIYRIGPETYSPTPWLYAGAPAFIGTFTYGIISAITLLKQRQIRKGVLFLFANFGCMLFILVYLVDAFFDYKFSIISFSMLFLIEGYIVFFVAIMAIELLFDLREKHHLEKSLTNQMERWKQTLDVVEMIVVELDREGIIRYINPFFSKLTGFQFKEIVGKSWFEHFLPKQEIKKMVKVRQERLATGKPFYFQNPVLMGTGEEAMIFWSNVILIDKQKQTEGTLSFGVDITDREKAFKEIEKLKRHLEEENIILKEEILHRADFNIIGESDAIKYSLQKVQQVAPSNSSVLVQGETGVGKELFAQAIHMESKRHKSVFVKVNCAALPRELIESELFGHERGAFTGAVQQKKGRFELADGGTIFLDEIGELPLELQPKLLRVLQSGEFERLGSEKTKKTDVRIISATNRDLADEVDKGNFREDLFYRLNVYPLTIPPLRDRAEDISLLTHFFVKKISEEQGKVINKITKGVLDQLESYDWPGNIRELINILERAVIHTSGNSLKRVDVLNRIKKRKEDSYMLSYEEMEKRHINQVLEKTDWKISGKNSASEILKINPNTLRSRMQKLSISREEKFRQ
jgi:PAS domain S-box-containing protein